MGKIIGSVILGIAAIVCFFISYLQFSEKGFLFSNEYIYASKQKRKAMDKKSYYKQSGIVFLMSGIAFSTSAVAVFLQTGWLIYCGIAVGIAAIVYAIISSMTIGTGKK